MIGYAEVVQQDRIPDCHSGDASSSLAFRSIGEKEANQMLQHHYLGPVYGIQYAFALDDAVAAYTNPRSRMFQERVPFKSLELARLWKSDNNSLLLSSFICQTLKKLRFEDYEMIVSYADPAVGHNGGIYKASNFVYLGTERASLGHPEFYLDGRRTSPRWFYDNIGTSSVTKVKEHFGDRVKTEPRIPKHRFVYPLTHKCRKWVKENWCLPRKSVKDFQGITERLS